MDRQSLSRKTELDRIKTWIAADPEKAWAALLAKGLQPITIYRILSGKRKGAPRAVTRRAFSDAAGMAETFFFPVVEDGKEDA